MQKFLEEHRDKRQVSERQTGTDQEPIAAGEEAGNNTARGPARQKGPLFLYSDEEEETGTAPHRQRGAEAKHKGKTSLSARDLYGQWEEPAGRRGAGSEGDPEGVEEELCRARRQGDTSRLSRVCPPHKSLRGSSPVLPSGWDRGMKEASPPPRNSGKKGVEFDLCKNAFCSDPGSFSGLLVKERLVSRDLVDPVRKDEEFRTIFQHLQIPQLCWSSNEMFDQHIVGIVHQIKAKHFQSSGLTLNERFAMYQRRAAEKDLRPRKSPEIHRRIDVSPSAFMKHSFLFEEMENSRTSGYKDQVKIMKDYSMDLQPDKERRKKHSNKERDHRWAGGRESGDSRGSSQERSTEKPSKRHKKSKKSKKKRERSRSSSTSSLRREGDYPSEEPPEKAFPKAPWGPRDHGDPMERGQPRGGFISGGQGWSRANHIGNNSGSINPSTEIPVRPPEDEWEQEDGPKSKKYYMHEERKGEQWPDSRGHGRGKFLYCGRSPKWSHDKFQGKAEEGELSESEQDPQEGDKKGAFSSKQ
ncbi:hypothetical protein MATL_G00230870 [Megalops atlanticus]|uniref:Thyroid hormone receptor-associated protein 3 n=1 Tax=Megalops atlanticus TaxID=7932 RepID=A0A9D3T214_MEGAT|nr:hypothetical protein MATL_G00230870 [Megalops atlanticus]